MEKQQLYAGHFVPISPVTTVDELNTALDCFDCFIKYTEKCDASSNKDERFIDNMFRLCRDIPIELKHSNKIEIRTSKIHGKGVFARDLIRKGTIVTFYPAHAIWVDDKLHSNEEAFCHRVIRDKLGLFYGTSDYSYEYRCLTVVGDPEKIHNKNLCGHMLNDSVGNVFKDIKYVDIQNPLLFKKTTSKYYVDGAEKRNCVIKYHLTHPCVYVMTTRDIRKDEELLIVYGAPYWYDSNYDKNDAQDNEYSMLLTKIGDFEYVKWFLSIYPEYGDYM